MRTREKSKAQLLATIKDLERHNSALFAQLDEAIANRDRWYEKNKQVAQDCFNHAQEVVKLRGDLTTLDKQISEEKDATRELRSKLEYEELFSKSQTRRIMKLEDERDRARAALVEASINASRLVAAVEPFKEMAQ